MCVEIGRKSVVEVNSFTANLRDFASARGKLAENFRTKAKKAMHSPPTRNSAAEAQKNRSPQMSRVTMKMK
jgi:hypothetical protein